MATPTKWKIHDKANEYLGDGVIDLDNDTFVLALYTTASNVTTVTVNPATAATNELSGNGYSRYTLTPTWTQNGSTTTFDTDNATFTASGGNLSPRYAAILDTTVSTGGGDPVTAPILCSCDLNSTGGPITVNDGNTLTVGTTASIFKSVASTS